MGRQVWRELRDARHPGQEGDMTNRRLTAKVAAGTALVLVAVALVAAAALGRGSTTKVGSCSISEPPVAPCEVIGQAAHKPTAIIFSISTKPDQAFISRSMVLCVDRNGQEFDGGGKFNGSGDARKVLKIPHSLHVTKCPDIEARATLKDHSGHLKMVVKARVA
jgi:hypothetical protein